MPGHASGRLWAPASPFRTGRGPGAGGFTLVELLVVVAIAGLLASLLLPSLASAKRAGRKAVCISNQRQIGIALALYAHDHGGRLPYGPKAPPFTSPANFYPSTGSPTSLLSLRDGQPVGLGLTLGWQLERARKVFFCPGSDQPLDSDHELAKVGRTQAEGSYYYRHGGNTRLFDDPNPTSLPEAPLLDSLGLNRNGLPIRALAVDSQFLCPPDLASFSVLPRTHHGRRLVNVLRADGSVVSRSNAGGRYTVDLGDYASLRDAFNRILKVLEEADREE